ncbi:MAG: tRNA (guanosine(37)-N1)-methyltransferase TrmD [Proteobacteria bacterium]|nr:tRNA (guanosine(37)-N1)-methyltransferase TrmD [Pseudomonadota bacterium]MBU4382569.1 tRNA (guanosine(37)-N1)-methyltransferase TrmD [Pseudomonadota bacterium]MCG2765085.1 tRNA (guanosine(37)-N1)-methyltransferase TrmD [Desulfarculaceae bacterium]
MIFDILTLLPEVCAAYVKASILGRAQKAGLIEVRMTNIRDFAFDRHRTVDDAPYGGGNGMVMKVEPLVAALESLAGNPRPRIVLMAPQGRPFDQEMAAELAGLERLVIICGRYEGIDERVRKLAVDQEISLGDFVLSGGELPALAVVDAVSRLIPGVLGGECSASADSFSDGLLEHPHYTRPPEFRGLGVPEVLTSGNHGAIERWRRKESLRRTLIKRPELLEKAPLGPEDHKLLAEIRGETDGAEPG